MFITSKRRYKKNNIMLSFTSSGTWTCPDNCTQIMVEGWGGGYETGIYYGGTGARGLLRITILEPDII